MDLILEKLVGEVKEKRYYSLLADDATDCCLKEQLALLFRFVDKKTTLGRIYILFRMF